ncbi:hypothetical protein [Haloarcula rubripromontorii]|uniref:hypothetical protein n=1 Tax=Haloarcula rubripromontorii TaxID=1705562 RepID=UPI00345BECBA
MSRRYSFGGDRARSVLLATVVVLSAVVGAVGPAFAQTETDSGPQTYEFTGGEILVVDTTDMSGTVTVTWSTQGTPGSGSQVLAKSDVDTTSTNGVALANLGAYDSVNATVEGSGTASTNTYGGRLVMPDGYTMLGGTGGDADLQCGIKEKLARAVDSGFTQLDCTAQPGSTIVNTTGTDAQQTKLDIYQSAQNQKGQSESFYTTLDNYLSDTKTQARIIGKNTYIRALNNGSSKSAAKTEAKAAVRDYYATKESNLLENYEAQIANYEYLHSIANSESGLTSSGQRDRDATVDTNIHPKTTKGNGRAEWEGTTQLDYQLVNGSTTQVTYNKIRIEADYSGAEQGSIHNLGPTNTTVSHSGDVYVSGLRINGTDSGEPPILYYNTSETHTRLTEIESQKTTVVSDMDTLAENTYSAYQQGEINNSDLVDPYVLASQQSAGSDFQGWTAAQLSLLGQNSPENFDQIGSFNVTTGDGTQYEGVLFSQENPASGTFETGTTYDTANIGGTQYLVTSDRIVELDGTFTINEITTTSGETTQNVTIQKTTYETTNVTELKQQYEDLARRRAEIEAREQNLQGSAGGGLLGGSSSSLVIGLIAVAALYAVSQRRSGGKY